MSFRWLEEGATPELSALGKRIAACIRKHGYTERSWLVSRVEKQIEEFGIGRAIFTVGQVDGAWKVIGERPQ